MNNLLKLVFFLFSTQVFSVSAQTYYFDKYDVRDGLPHSKVYCTVQDQHGFVWAGTGIGISKFDGISFQNFSSDSGLAENGVKSILIDSRGVFWIGHIGGGITRYNGSKFEQLKLKNITHDITSIVEDHLGMIWFSTVGDGVLRIENPSEKEIKSLKYKNFKGKEALSDFVFAIYKRKNAGLLFITDLGLKQFDFAKQNFTFFGKSQVPGYFQITCMHEDAQNHLWFGTYNGGLYNYVEAQGFVKVYDAVRDGLALNWISTINSDKEGNKWIGTWGGGITVIRRDNSIENFNESNGLFDTKIWSIIEDREGNILIGTNENGMLIYKGKKFMSITKANGLNNEQVWAISVDLKGDYWFGTNEGISVFDKNFSNARSFTPQNSQLASKQVRFLKRDKAGNIWIGTNDNGIQYYTHNGGQFVFDPLLNKYFPSTNSLVSALEIDRDNNIWMGTTEWLVYYEIGKNKITALTQGNGLAGNDISALYCDKKNNIWVGSRRKGLAKISGSDIKKLELNSNFTPNCMVEDLDGNLWVGTEDRGILVLRDGKVIKKIKTGDGLRSNNILALNVDANNKIFIGTSSGLSRYDQKTGQLLDYTEKSGFTGIEVKSHASFQDSKNRLWFGTVRGAVCYTPNLDKPNLKEPLTFISRFRVNLVDKPLEKSTSLYYLDRSITFNFGSVCLSNAEGIKYQYKLVGADKEWIPAVKNLNTVTYSPLSPGEYTFMVKASNNEGVWNQKPVSFSFVIRPPFWRTWWFYVLTIIILGISVLLFIRLRVKHLVKEKKRLEQKVAERTAEVVKEKENSEALLLNTLPSKVVEDLKRYGKTEPESFENVTVYFSDICSFTDISSQLDPKVTINELNDLFTAFDDIMEKNNCERIKTFGDGYMAVCGLPEKNENHAVQIMKAAIEIKKYLINRATDHEIKWRVRIGIHTGKVTGGIVGVRKYLYDIFGDTVNTASRMESNYEPMRINCSETTYLLLKDHYKFTAREAAPVKGKGLMNMYFLEEA